MNKRNIILCIIAFRCSLFGAFFKLIVRQSTTTTQRSCFDAPCLELSLNTAIARSIVHKLSSSFDAPCLELSLNLFCSYKNSGLDDSFDAPCLELSLN